MSQALRDPRKTSNLKKMSTGISRDSGQSIRLKSAKTGNSLGHALLKTVVHLLMDNMNSTQNKISLKTIRPSYARDSTKNFTAHMVQDANLNTPLMIKHQLRMITITHLELFLRLIKTKHLTQQMLPLFKPTIRKTKTM